ncbi:MAG: hypothetical protein ACI9BV_003784 [Rhodothermales bacterium]|jgi:hypothetical protein
MLRVFYGHHKCATGWTNDIVREICYALGWRFLIVNTEAELERHGGLRALSQDRRIDFLALSNAQVRYVDALGDHRAFHIIRDPRDQVVSGYFSHRNSHPTDSWPELSLHRDNLKQLSKDAGLTKEMEFSRPFVDAVSSWNYEDPRVLEVRMEDLTSDPEQGFRDILQHLEMTVDRDTSSLAVRRFFNVLHQRGHERLPFGLHFWPWATRLEGLPDAVLDRILERKSFSRLSGGRKPGEIDPSSHYRKGVAGDWKNHFSARHRAVFEESFPGLVERLGYDVE